MLCGSFSVCADNQQKPANWTTTCTKMEAQKLTELLRATIDPNPEQRKAAEDQLAQVSGKLITSKGTQL